ncbi:DUF4314 domain-containing protein [Massiliimalia massiliensis]|uniref:DUF4314 domain-containing protein n=1 Tax=Massiliimalia massiliensis TaxID=1852384 RepID=UPI001E63DB05|nr:DUF4314 domain-containing protein [Massiliimalia massiliensis]
MQKKDEKQPLRIKSLAELKRAIQPGTEIKALSHSNYPDLIGLVRVVTEVQTNAFYSKIKDQPNHRLSACNYGKGFRSDFEKAGCYLFDGTTVKVLNSRKNDGSLLYEMEVYSPENSMTETTKTEENKLNEYEKMRRMVQRTKETYPPGTRLELISMDDPYAPVPSGTRGTLRFIDDMGTLHMQWDNGRTLGIVPGRDSFRMLTEKELLEERMEKLPRVSGKLVALTSDDNKSFMGYATDRSWNGWECPLFSKASADKIMAHINENGCQMTYDAEDDSYTVKYPDDDAVEAFEGEDYLINGNIEHLYPIGSHSWTWDRAPEENEYTDEGNAPVMGM